MTRRECGGKAWGWGAQPGSGAEKPGREAEVTYLSPTKGSAQQVSCHPAGGLRTEMRKGCGKGLHIFGFPRMFPLQVKVNKSKRKVSCFQGQESDITRMTILVSLVSSMAIILPNHSLHWTTPPTPTPPSRNLTGSCWNRWTGWGRDRF